MKRREWSVFWLSLVSSTAVLLAERIVGIGWDYHPDSVFYATGSADVVAALRTQGFAAAFNNGYYVICWFLGQSVPVITAMNMALFAGTNVLLFRAHVKYSPPTTRLQRLAIWLLLLNPYRLHLSTTLLKDSLLILITVRGAESLIGFLGVVPLLALLRVAAVLYGAPHVRGRYLLVAVLGIAGLFVLFPDAAVDFVLKANEQEMVFRTFDNVPTFQEFGLLGAMLRGVAWPILAISGLFAVLSPSLLYMPVAIGSIATMAYCGLVARTLRVPAGIVLALCVFAVLAPGFTAYVRYVTPLMVVWPLALLKARTRGGARTRAVSLAQVRSGPGFLNR